MPPFLPRLSQDDPRRRPSFRRRIAAVAACALALAAGLPAARAADAVSAWQALAAASYREARDTFRHLQQTQPALAREAKLGEAAALLNLQPVTAANRDAARRLCTELAAGSPADPWTQQARFLLGRIAEIHTTPADFRGACAHYEWLFKQPAPSDLGQLALVKFAILQLHESVPAAETARRYAALVALEPRLVSAPARRDFHLVLADACLQHDLGREQALRHLLAAEAAGVQQPMRAATVLVQIAEISRALGQTAQARAYYQRFLATVGSEDIRARLVREHLAALPAEGAP